MMNVVAWLSRSMAAFLGAALAVNVVWAQVQPDPLPAPNIPLLVTGTVSALAQQADGGVLVAGSFNFVNGRARSNLARIKPDGTVDDAWAATFNNSISTIAVNATTGAVYVGGYFTTINGVTRNRIARFDASGQLDTSWDPSASSTVTALAVDSAGDTVYAGGAFTTIGSQTHGGLAKIAGSGTGAVDATWSPAATSFSTTSVMVVSNGALYLGGSFTTVTSNGATTATTRNRLAKLDAASGVLDTSWDPSASGQVSTMVVDAANDVVYVGGSFSRMGAAAVSRQGLAKIGASGTGALDLTWNPAANSAVNSLALDGAIGTLYVGGAFTTMTDSGGTTAVTRNRLAKIGAANGLIDPAWAPSADSSVTSIVFSSDASTLYVGGSFGTIGSTTQLSFAALAASDGTLESAPEFANMGSVASIKRQSNGGIVVGGSFLKAGTMARTFLLRLNGDGSLDPNFNPVFSSTVSSLAIGADDSIYVTGYFTTINGVAESSIAKLDGATGAVNTNWSCALSGPASTMVESGSSLYIGGSFTSVCGAVQNRLAKLDAATGARDASWAPNPSSFVNALAADASGAIYVGGSFTTISGAAHPYIAKLDGSTGVPAGWNPAVNSAVSALAADGNGALYVGGSFISATVGGTTGVTRNRLLKLDTETGEVDANWNPNSSANVNALLLDGYGSLYVATNSSTATMGGMARPYLSKVDADDMGAVSANWNPAPSANVTSLALGVAGEIYAGGTFSLMGTTARAALAALPPGPTSTTTIISVSPEPSVVGEVYTVAVSVAVASGTATGSVTISDDLGASCTASLSSGAGSCALTSDIAGTRALLAVYHSTDFSTSSATTTHMVGSGSTSLTIGNTTPTTSVYGEDVAVAYTVAVESPAAGLLTGEVSVSLDGVVACTADVNAGGCTITAALLDAGDQAIDVAYAGDSNFAPSSSSMVLTVTPAVVTITLGNLAQTYDGTPRLVTVTTDPSDVAVTLTYESGSAPIDAGSYGIAVTSADANYAGSASGTLVVAQAATITTITDVSPPNPTPGQAVTVSYAVSSIDGVSGTVTVLADTGESCTGTVAEGNCTLSFAAPGSRSITASYAGDMNHAAGSSAAASLTVVPASVTITLGNLGQTYDGTPRIVAVATVPANIATTLTYNNGPTTPVHAGSYTVVATSADPNYSGTATATLIVAQATSATRITGATPPNAEVGQPVAVSYAVSGDGILTGEVTVFADSGESCIATAAAGQCELTFGDDGAHVLAASYAGDADHTNSMSANYYYADSIFANGFDGP